MDVKRRFRGDARTPKPRAAVGLGPKQQAPATDSSRWVEERTAKAEREQRKESGGGKVSRSRKKCQAERQNQVRLKEKSVLAPEARSSAIESPFTLLSADRLSGRTLSESLEARFFEGSRRKDFGQFSQQEPNSPQHTPQT